MKGKILLYTALFLMLLTATSFAATFDIEISPEKQSTFQGESATYVLTVNNTGSDKERFGISVLGDNSWVTIDDNNIDVEPGASGQTNIFIEPPREARADNYGFEFGVTPSDESGQTKSDSVILSVKIKEGVIINSVNTNKKFYNPEETLVVTTELESSNPDSSNGSLRFVVTDSENNIMTEKTLQIEIPTDEVVTFEDELNIGDWDSGKYNLETSLKKGDLLVHVKETSFDVNPVVNLNQEKDTAWLLYKFNVDITVSNSGNSDAKDVEVKESINPFWNRFVSQEGANVDGNTYTWNIDNVPADGTKRVSYSINLLPVYLGILAGAGILYWLYWLFFTPKIRKHVLQKTPLERGNSATVLLRVKNKGRRKLKNVHIEDLVAPALKVTSTGSPLGDTKNTDKGTHVKWSLGSINPGEERMLRYDVKAVMGVLGDIKLPKARMRGTKGETRKEYYSNAPKAEGEVESTK